MFYGGFFSYINTFPDIFYLFLCSLISGCLVVFECHVSPLSSVFFLVENVLNSLFSESMWQILSFFLRDSLTEYVILGWQLLFPQHFHRVAPLSSSIYHYWLENNCPFNYHFFVYFFVPLAALKFFSFVMQCHHNEPSVWTFSLFPFGHAVRFVGS